VLEGNARNFPSYLGIHAPRRRRPLPPHPRPLRFRRALAAAILSAVLLPQGPARAERFDLALWDALLAAYTRAVPDAAGVRVDYRGLRGDSRWPVLLAGLAAAEPPRAAEGAAHLAFWINAYNALAIDVVLEAYPVASIRDAGSFLRPVWDRPAGTVGGRTVSLGEIEHRILRPLGEPRIHAAIVCASTSCPSLRREGFRAERLDAQLEDALRGFLADPRKGSRLEADARALTLSPIFQWFAEDFDAAGGVRAYLAPRLPAESARALVERGDALALRYFDYDWALNDLAAGG
jgi:hypothetical protein